MEVGEQKEADKVLKSPETVDELPPSEMGTKEYWDTNYSVEIENFKNYELIDEGWFGGHIVRRLIGEFEICLKDVKKDDPIIDLGCGNGVLLLGLADRGHTNLTGVDYSEKAIELAKTIAFTKGVAHIKFLVLDIVNEEVALKDYAVVIDKGTYDAISIDPENARAKRDAYKANLMKLLRPLGRFVISSCNWTKEELLHEFKSDFEYIPQEFKDDNKFQFGGKTGSTVTTVIFQLKNNEYT
ncbi:EEF1A lysine methyltransferase 2 [Homalodisca vitripennis]|uniref:EEF1A lysine methyltransferase 2 n=1 Tax=Homalodisca vitripennis TaxID=197043 RepID=UPI001EE9D77C|nr:EEF1A lysine methyltransferase 2 [Homalodisca vitripennis]XP_046686647.1 EEF1A lysine methyltransferase 2 [Homalodisca vitripennis]XP_046686653.1 EEF1A lysine methyltransferase 2 [Homalodisca vitripennis]XP_046686659.1 EEF1A lysine methyltransferase 2 [Homalodisca vitripennis]XP_046686665.1 EEF1A lysine methyltransferase 2 [Homalodisca vitripennis]XP_046686672.1 EEF1A lysine methyltransferase 2 [Homalodisca vitripennis]XP_046686675.1 EEF1A lysine methyltransferase 2 [Homalodisca vitripenni